MELSEIKNTRHRAIITNINDGIDMDSIIKRHGISKPTYYKTKQRYAEALTELQTADITTKDVAEYGSRLIDKGKFITLKLADTLIKKSFVGASISQLTTSMVNVNNMLRLEQGKSTENIAHNVLHNLGEAEKELIRESIATMKKSMIE